MKCIAWSDTEIKVLCELTGQPRKHLVSNYNARISALNEKLGTQYPQRTEHGIIGKIRGLEVSRRAFNNTYWSDTEVNILISLLGHFLIAEVTRRYNAEINKINEETGTHYIRRSESSVIGKVRQLQLSTKAHENYITIGETVKLLGISDYKIRNWIKTNKLNPIKQNKKKTSYYAFTKQDFIQLSEKYPQLLWGCNHEGLEYFIGKCAYQKWQSIVTKPKRAVGRFKIRDKRTGEIITTTEAGKLFNYSRASIIRKAKNNTAKYWEIIN